MDSHRGRYSQLRNDHHAADDDQEKQSDLPTRQPQTPSSVSEYSLLLTLVIILALLWHIWSMPTAISHQTSSLNPIRKESKVVAVVFYGRAKYVEILDCYLQRNLVSNGGWLDEVRFLANTDDQNDIAWINKASVNVPEYKITHLGGGNDYYDMWATMNETDTVYIKIDDDTVWIADDAIAHLVNALQDHPEANGVTANVINTPILQWFHYRTGAIKPFVPEWIRDGDDAARPVSREWRVSGLPLEHRHPAHEFQWADPPARPRVKNQGMRPLPLGHESLRHTPAYFSDYSKSGYGWNKWEVAAQEHYSFFYNLEHSQLHTYVFGGSDGTWNLHYDYMNINFLAMRGKDVDVDWLRKSGQWDEPALTEGLTRAKSRPILVATQSLVSHFAYNGQRDFGFEDTDCISRYRALAEELACPHKLQWDW